MNSSDPDGNLVIGSGIFPSYCEGYAFVVCTTLNLNFTSSGARNFVANTLLQRPTLQEVYFEPSGGYPERHADVYSRTQFAVAEVKVGGEFKG